MPTAVLRRYTPPTCTLEVQASGSALSRWTDRTVLKNLQFQLSFDDPKLMPDQQVMVSGDQNQLEALHETVTDYVQHLLGQPPSAINWEPSLSLDPSPEQISESLPEPLLASDLQPEDLALQPQGLLSHELRLGSLANAESGTAVRLTTLQLFDLANALEDYHAESLSLPVAESPAWMSRLPRSWPSVAAAVLALGVTGAMTKFVFDISRPTAVQTASAPNERQANTELNRELFPKLSPPNVSPSATLQPLPPPPPAAGANRDALGLPPIGVTQAPPRPSAPIPGALPGQAAGQSEVRIVPSSGVALPTETNSETNIAAAPPRLTPTDDASAADSFAAGSTSSSSVAESGVAAAPQAASRAAAPPATSTTAFDTIPQVAEVRSYFQQRWQPPEGLSQTLEYRLLLNADGSLQRIVPLGQFSENYLDRTNMPLLGESFVSATNSGETPQIRLVLKPDGKVQSFLEYAN